MAVREDCRHYSTRTIATGEVVLFWDTQPALTGRPLLPVRQRSCAAALLFPRKETH